MRGKLEKEDVSVDTGGCRPCWRAAARSACSAAPLTVTRSRACMRGGRACMHGGRAWVRRCVGACVGACACSRARVGAWVRAFACGLLRACIRVCTYVCVVGPFAHRLLRSLLLPARQVLEALLDKSVTIKVLLDTKIGMTVKAKRSKLACSLDPFLPPARPPARPPAYARRPHTSSLTRTSSRRPAPTRKHADSKVAEMASNLTSKWKEVVEKSRGGSGGSTPKVLMPEPVLVHARTRARAAGRSPRGRQFDADLNPLKKTG